MPLMDNRYPSLENDLSTIGYTPDVLTDWDADADPGTGWDAVDQLAERVDDIDDDLTADTLWGRYTGGAAGPTAPSDVLRILSSGTAWWRPIQTGEWCDGIIGSEYENGTFTWVADRLYGVPFFIPWRVAWDGIGFECTVAEAGKNAKIGIYNMTAAGVPGTRIYNGNASPLALNAIGAKSIAGIATTLEPGVYVLAIITDATTARMQANGSGFVDNRGYLCAAGCGLASRSYWYSNAGNYVAGLPDPFGAPLYGTSFWPRMMLGAP